MGTLSYTATVSIDGFAADSDGDFQWSAPDDEVFAFHVERMGPISTEILGRKTYLLMRYWEHEPADDPWGPLEKQFAQAWGDLRKVVVSTTLTDADLGAPHTRLVPELDLAELRRIVDEEPGEVEIFGPTTAAAAIRAGLVTDFRFFIVPKLVGGGLRALPADARLDLQLVEQRAYGDTVYVHYRARR